MSTTTERIDSHTATITDSYGRTYDVRLRDGGFAGRGWGIATRPGLSPRPTLDDLAAWIDRLPAPTPEVEQEPVASAAMATEPEAEAEVEPATAGRAPWTVERSWFYGTGRRYAHQDGAVEYDSPFGTVQIWD
ncbi:hypothetical protein MF406_14095 [Georgenia sp. TF02-10]|uniref:hypothetical protein n=1 Tax=Georgenia sp. TF02-10 TaxID=2917725 RepID=UPI001FA756C6|nr:hypothetical protein [Georgenia sp. TF02-10]UNX54064.1 hypothetical protein MF406_14095 [Georgenia sp. TF02-10]